MKITNRKQKGFSLLAAIFVMVVLALISTYIVSIAAMSRSTNTLAIEGMRAYFAARSGVEWGVFQVVNNPGSCFTSPTNLGLSQGGVDGYNVRVTCSVDTFLEGAGNFNIFTVTAFATKGTFGSTNYSSREMRVKVTLGSP